MEKTFLVAGKDLPDGEEFVETAALANRNVIATTNATEQKVTVGAKTISVPWIRTSPVSARTVVLQCESNFVHLDEAVLYFDESYFASRFDSFTIEDCSRCIDYMVLSYQYLAMSLINRFEKKFDMQEDSISENNTSKQNEARSIPKIIFLLKKAASECDVVKNSGLRSIGVVSNPFSAAAAASFEAFAENIAAVYGSKNFVDIILIKSDWTNELSRKDSILCSWLCNYLDDLDKAKRKSSLKQGVYWIKAGAKAGVLSLFK